MAEGFDFACIRGELIGKGVSETVADLLEEAYNNLRRAFPTQSHAQISERLLQVVQNRRYKRAQLAATQMRASARIQNFIAGGRDKQDQLRRLRFIMSRDPTGQSQFADNFESIRATILTAMDAKMGSTLQAISPRWFHSIQDRALMDEVGEVLMGNRAGKSEQALAMGDAVRSMFDDSLERFRYYGLRIGEQENFLPARHNEALVAGTDRNEWIDFVLETNDFSKKINRDTGDVFTDEEIREVLSSVYDKITSNGADIYDAFNMERYTRYVDRFERERFFQWKDYESWKKYQERFGNDGNLLETLAHYRNSAARDLAIIHTLGPDPQKAVNDLKAAAEQIAGRDGARDVVQRLDKQWGLISGNFAIPTNNWMAASQEWLSALVRLSTLGGSGIASLNDQVFSGSSRHFYGLSVRDGLPDFIRGLNDFYGRNKSERLTKALRGGMGADILLSGLIGNQRAMGEFVGPRFLHRMNDIFFRINGTVPITEATRYADGVAASIGLRSVVEDGLDAANPNLRAALEAYGVTQEMLDRIKGDEYKLDYGSGFGLNIPKIVEDFGLSAAAPFQSVVNDIRFMSSPAPSVDIRAFLGGQAGEARTLLWQSFTMFWQFPMAAWQSQVTRRLRSSQSNWTTGRQLAATFVVGSMLGTVLVQSRQILAGKTPYEWDDPELWTAGGLMSGMLGVVGDYAAGLFQRRFTAAAITGPLADPIVGLGQTIGAVGDEVFGESGNIASPLTRTIRSVTPLQNFPIVGLAINRLLIDQLRVMLDNDAYQYFRSRAKSLQKNTGQREWWRQGEWLPEALK